MPVYGKACGFPTDLGNRNNRFPHSLRPATIANIDIQKPKGAFPSLPTVLLQAHPSIGKDCGGSVCSDRFFGLLSGKIVQLVVVVAVGM
jgi:hypothetical protein